MAGYARLIHRFALQSTEQAEDVPQLGYIGLVILEVVIALLTW